jgi:anti-sigma regulatory factor (Ser/Thr protein kinase)
MGGAQWDDADSVRETRKERPAGLGRFGRQHTEPVVSALFLAEAESAPRARRALERLEPLMSWPTYADLRLLVSELVANSVEHSGANPDDLIGLEVHVRDERLLVEVTDPGPGFDLPYRPTSQPWEAEYGRGLLIVDSLAQSWGVAHGERSSVWFELAVPGLLRV